MCCCFLCVCALFPHASRGFILAFSCCAGQVVKQHSPDEAALRVKGQLPNIERQRERKGETEEERVNTVRVTVQPWCCVRRGEGQRTRTYNSFPLYPALCSVHTLCLTCLFSGWLVFHPCHYHTTTRRLTHLGASLHHASRFSPSHSLQTLVDRLKPSWLP